MPIKGTYDKQVNVIRMSISNPISVEDFVAEYRQIIENPDIAENVPSLWDLSALDLGRIPLSDIRALPRAIGALAASRGDHVRVAIVCTRVMDYQLLRVYLGILKLIGSNMKMRLFPDMASAQDWVSISER